MNKLALSESMGACAAKNGANSDKALRRLCEDTDWLQSRRAFRRAATLNTAIAEGGGVILLRRETHREATAAA